MALNDIEEEIRRQMLAERAAAAPPVPPPQDDPPAYYGAPKRKSGAGGLAGAGAALLALLAKFKFLLVGLKLLTFGKLLLTGGSMLLSMWAWGRLYGWPFGVGLVLLIFAHECGHALAARMRGVPVGVMVFLPLVGAFVTTRRDGRGPTDGVFISIMGPAVGALAAVACAGGYWVDGRPFWLALGAWGLLINLLNLAPIPPLDGGRIAPFVWTKWPAFLRPAPGPEASPADRRTYGVAYLGLILSHAVGVYGLYTLLHANRPL